VNAVFVVAAVVAVADDIALVPELPEQLQLPLDPSIPSSSLHFQLPTERVAQRHRLLLLLRSQPEEKPILS
jgi:hypothetical protein